MKIKTFNEMNNSNTLPDKWQDHLANLPESGMGFQICDIKTSTGIFKNVLIENSSVIKTEYPIDLGDIQDIKLSLHHTNQGLVIKK